MTELSGGSPVAAASLSHDELTICFHRSPAADRTQLFTATRTTRGDAFGDATELKTLEGDAGLDGTPSLSGNGLSVVWSSDRAAPDAGVYKLYSATRSSKTDPFSLVTELSFGGNATDSDADPFLTSSGDELWFSSNRSGRSLIYRAEAKSGGFADPILSSPSSDDAIFPVLSDDKRTLYFGSASGNASGASAVWRSHRTGTTGLDAIFSPPQRVDGLASATEGAFPTWLSPDGCRLYLSKATVGVGNWRIFVAERTP